MNPPASASTAPPTLIDARRHAFALLILEGVPAGRAYERAGYHQRGARADSAGHKLRHRPAVAAFIAHERESLRKSAQITREQLAAWLVAVIRTPCGDLDGTSPLVQKFSRDEIGEAVIRTRVEMVSKLEACRQLAALMSWDEPERVEFTAAAQLADLIQTIRGK
jgi:hypothetical protein